MTTTFQAPPQKTSTPDHSDLLSEFRAVAARIAPVWPLDRFVAVNPYFGMAELPFGEVAARLETLAAAKSTLSAREYLDLFAQGEIREEDVATALQRQGRGDLSPPEFLDKVRAALSLPDAAARVPTVGDTVAELTGTDWGKLADERIAAWAACYFDEGQALWPSADSRSSAYRSWRREAMLDRTPGVMGLSGVREEVASLPEDPLAAARLALHELALPPAEREWVLHALLMRLGGWSAVAARMSFEAGLGGEEDNTLVEILCIRLAWELVLYRRVSHPGLAARWVEKLLTLKRLAVDSGPSESLTHRILLQEAYDCAEQRRLAGLLSVPARPESRKTRPSAQAVFCIDVRSEVYRRHLEAVAPEVETLGFAGFFAFPIAVRPLGHQKALNQCPVLLSPGFTVPESLGDEALDAEAVEKRTWLGHVRRAWTSFKMGAISCFSFVGPVGLAYLPKLFTDSFGLTRPVAHPDSDGLDRHLRMRRAARMSGSAAEGIPEVDRIALAKGALTAMSLTDGFAPLVLIIGHGSSTVNNPHATGLDCGACGGRSGEANARVAAEVLNDAAVRKALSAEGISIPEDTFFLACRHDTTTDEVEIFNHAEAPPEPRKGIPALQAQLEQAGALTRAERSRRLFPQSGGPIDQTVRARSRDWAQVRPEWGLAGCSAFVAAPRGRTANLDLGGRCFLHSYDWQQDRDFGVLELILTAPVVVASWISLQYYASTVENGVFGSGNKTLHNVVGRIGVLEGNGGDLRVGLPWQSVHDGQQRQHPPQRLNVILDAPAEAIDAVLAKHDHVRHLAENGWIYLWRFDENRLALRSPGGEWE